MIVKHIKGYVVNQLKYKVILFAICFAINATLGFYYFTNQGQENKFRADTKSLQSEIESTRDKIVKATYAIDRWNDKVKFYHETRTGLKLDYIRRAIEQLREIYKIKSLTINLSTPTLRHDIIGAKFIDIEYSAVTMTYSTFTDLDAYRFLLALLSEFPGYTQVKSFTISSIQDLTQDILSGIEKGTAKDIVTVRVDILWQDLSDKKEVHEQLKKDAEAKQKQK